MLLGTDLNLFSLDLVPLVDHEEHLYSAIRKVAFRIRAKITEPLFFWQGVLMAAIELNDRLRFPLPTWRVRRSARNVAKFVWRNFSAKRWTNLHRPNYQMRKAAGTPRPCGLPRLRGLTRHDHLKAVHRYQSAGAYFTHRQRRNSTDALIRASIAHLETNGVKTPSISLICRFAYVDRKTYYNWRSRDRRSNIKRKNVENGVASLIYNSSFSLNINLVSRRNPSCPVDNSILSPSIAPHSPLTITGNVKSPPTRGGDMVVKEMERIKFHAYLGDLIRKYGPP